MALFQSVSHLGHSETQESAYIMYRGPQGVVLGGLAGFRAITENMHLSKALREVFSID